MKHITFFRAYKKFSSKSYFYPHPVMLMLINILFLHIARVSSRERKRKQGFQGNGPTYLSLQL